jgi:hypothetical protein
MVACGCGGDPASAPDAGNSDAGNVDAGTDAGSLVRLHGGVQKGPFVLGSSVAISPIDGVGNPTGTVFNTATLNDLGEFALEFAYLGPVSLEAQGYYYNEATGALSGSQLTLRAYHEVTTGGAQAAYVNILTHLTYGRVQTLVLGGASLAEATTQAESELRAGLGVGLASFTPEASGIYLSVLGGDNDSNAYLLAVSAVLAQAGVARGGDAGLQELLNVISTDLGLDGQLSDPLKAEILGVYQTLDGDAVMRALRARLAGLGSAAVVPDLQRVLDQDLDGLVNASDNCRFVANPLQENRDGDAWGDACDDDTLWRTPVWRSTELSTATSLAWGDLDNDGNLELAVGNQGAPTRVYRNEGGALAESAAWSSTESNDAYSVAWADVDGDGDQDLAVGNALQPNRLYRNDDGVLTTTSVWTPTELNGTTSLGWGDVDNDGDLDLAVGNFGRPNRVYRNDAGTLTLLWSSAESTADQTYSVAWGDVDGDGYLDLAVGTTGQNRLYRNAAGVLDATATWSSTEYDFTESVAWGDVDGDGDLDLAVGNYGVPNRLYRNDGGALTTTAAWSSTEADHTQSVAWGDLDGDGDLDLAVGNGVAVEPNRVYRNEGGTLSAIAAWNSADPGETNCVAWSDVDGDGDLDLAAGGANGVKLYLGIVH